MLTISIKTTILIVTMQGNALISYRYTHDVAQIAAAKIIVLHCNPAFTYLSQRQQRQQYHLIL
jgi:hypothetical protein